MAFVLSRLAYGFAGIDFDASTYVRYMQFIDPVLLVDRLFESLLFYHANPPMLNLITGLGLKFFGEQAETFFFVVFHIAGLVLAWSFMVLVQVMTKSRLLTYVATTLLISSPSFVLYENWYMYTFLSTALLTFGCACVARYLETRSAYWLHLLFLACALLVLTRSLFHFVWLLLLVIISIYLLRSEWKNILITAAIPLLLAGGWYAKNYQLFNSFSASSFFGIGLSNITSLNVSKEELEPYINDGTLSHYAKISRYLSLPFLFEKGETPKFGIPVLDEYGRSTGYYNYNYFNLLLVNKIYTRDGLKIIQLFPQHYLGGVAIANHMFFSTNDINPYFSNNNREAVSQIKKLYNPVFYGAGSKSTRVPQPNHGLARGASIVANTAYLTLVLWVSALVYCISRFWPVMTGRYALNAERAVLGFIVFNMLYVHLLATSVELSENYRYRFLVEPLHWVAVIALFREIYLKKKGAGERAG